MRYVSFQGSAFPEPRLGALKGEKVLDLARASDGRLPSRMLDFLEAGDAAWDQAKGLLQRPPSEAWLDLAKVRLLAPLPRPASLKDFFAFEEHAKAGSKRRGEELPAEWYQLPAYYKGNHREIYGPGDEVPWPYYTRRLDYECEIGAVIGRKGRNLSPEQARASIFGYMLFNDFSARDIQKQEMVLRMGPAKGKDFANAFGPWLVTADEFDPRRDGSMTARVNGELWSQGHFKDQYWGFDLMVSHVSQEETVWPGDVFGSGTFHKGCGLDLDRWLKPGDVIELEVAGLGKLSNKAGTPSSQRQLAYERGASHGR